MYNNMQMNSNIMFINSYQDVLNYPIRLNFTLLMLDSNSNTMYIKSADSNGKVDIYVYKFERVENEELNSGYNKKEIDTMRSDINLLSTKLQDICVALGINEKGDKPDEQHTESIG